MAYTVDRTQAFEDDFDESLDYLANELKSPQAAMTLIDEVEYALHVLEKSPFLYAVSRKPFLSPYGYREYHVKIRHGISSRRQRGKSFALLPPNAALRALCRGVGMKRRRADARRRAVERSSAAPASS